MARGRKPLKEIYKHINLYVDSKTGIAWVEDGNTGIVHTAHPTIDSSGSILGMKKLGYWGKNDSVVRCACMYHNVSRVSVGSILDVIAMNYCKCGGTHGPLSGIERIFDDIYKNKEKYFVCNECFKVFTKEIEANKLFVQLKKQEIVLLSGVYSGINFLENSLLAFNNGSEYKCEECNNDNRIAAG